MQLLTRTKFLKMFLLSVVVLVVSVVGIVFRQPLITHADGACRISPSFQNCLGKDPEASGCYQDATTLLTTNIYGSDKQTPIGRVDLRYSPACHSKWGRVISYQGIVPVLYVNIQAPENQSGAIFHHAFGGSVNGQQGPNGQGVTNHDADLMYSGMVYAPDIASDYISARVCGSITLDQNGPQYYAVITQAQFPGNNIPDEANGCTPYNS